MTYGHVSKRLDYKDKINFEIYDVTTWLIIGHLNINSIRSKFSGFKDLFLKETDIYLLSETKIDDSFPNSQFFADGYRMFRKDRNKIGGGLILYINEDIPGKLINSKKDLKL